MLLNCILKTFKMVTFMLSTFTIFKNKGCFKKKKKQELAKDRAGAHPGLSSSRVCSPQRRRGHLTMGFCARCPEASVGLQGFGGMTQE